MEGRLVWQQKHKKRKEEKEKLKKKKTRGFVLKKPKRPDYPKKIILTSVPWKLTKNISFESQLKFSALKTCLKARLRNVIINTLFNITTNEIISKT